MSIITDRLHALETQSAIDRANMITALSAQTDMVDTGFEEVRTNQAAAVAGLHTSLTRDLSAAIRSAGQNTDNRMTQLMNMIQQLTGVARPQVAGAGQPQIEHGIQAQLGNASTMPGQLPQIVLDGHNFAAPSEPPAAALQASTGFAAARERAREAIRVAGALPGAPDIIDAHTDPTGGAAGAGPGTMGPPQ